MCETEHGNFVSQKEISLKKFQKGTLDLCYNDSLKCMNKYAMYFIWIVLHCCLKLSVLSVIDLFYFSHSICMPASWPT